MTPESMRDLEISAAVVRRHFDKGVSHNGSRFGIW